MKLTLGQRPHRTPGLASFNIYTKSGYCCAHKLELIAVRLTTCWVFRSNHPETAAGENTFYQVGWLPNVGSVHASLTCCASSDATAGPAGR
jgi:hypothetical protein